MALKANSLLLEKARKRRQKEAGYRREAERGDLDAAMDEITDKTNQFTLSILFEALCQKLQHVQPYEIVRILDDGKRGPSGAEAFKQEPILHVSADNPRTNFYFLGDALRSLFVGGKLPFSSPSLDSLKSFMESTDIDGDGAAGWRQKIMSKLRQHKSKEELASFNQVLVQRTIEEAMELTNPICTIQLRNIVYVHNQLVKHRPPIHIRDFQAEHPGGQHSEPDASKNQVS